MDVIKEKLAQLPRTPGVYFHKDASGQIIYIGKAAVLNNRVRQYFQKSRLRDAKTDALVADIADISWTETETELDALFLEAELIRRYLPKYNILLRDDKSLSYVRIDYASAHPTVTLTRRPLDDKAEYFGPYFSAFSLKRALKYLRRTFPYSTHIGIPPKRACLQVHLGLCPGIESDDTPLPEYRKNLKQLMRYLRGERVQLMCQFEKDMKTAAVEQDFETAAEMRNKLYSLKNLSKQIIFSDREAMDISKDEGLQELYRVLGLKTAPRRIEGYDISHMQGTDTVASMVVFVSGLPDKSAYRKFKMHIPGNDDFAHMKEVIGRRLSEKNQKQWGMPDMIVVDGGKGQLSSAIAARDAANVSVSMIGLAKQEEQIIIHGNGSHVSVDESALEELGGFSHQTADFTIVSLPKRAHAVKLLQRIRDESHRFAVSYHSVLKQKRQIASLLEEIPGIGPATRKKLQLRLGGMRGVMEADEQAIADVIGPAKAKIVHTYTTQHRVVPKK
jgi:excinuclease ABC subunit C